MRLPGKRVCVNYMSLIHVPCNCTHTRVMHVLWRSVFQDPEICDWDSWECWPMKVILEQLLLFLLMWLQRKPQNAFSDSTVYFLQGCIVFTMDRVDTCISLSLSLSLSLPPLPINLFFVCLSVCFPPSPSIILFISVRVSVCLFVFLSVSLSAHLREEKLHLPPAQ